MQIENAIRKTRHHYFKECVKNIAMQSMLYQYYITVNNLHVIVYLSSDRILYTNFTPCHYLQ